MNKFYDNLVSFAKAAGVFNYVANQYLSHSKPASMRSQVDSTFNNLEQHEYASINSIYNADPTDPDAASLKAIADAEMKAMRILFNNL